jgi:hypothetical protein
MKPISFENIHSLEDLKKHWDKPIPELDTLGDEFYALVRAHSLEMLFDSPLAMVLYLCVGGLFAEGPDSGMLPKNQRMPKSRIAREGIAVAVGMMLGLFYCEKGLASLKICGNCAVEDDPLLKEIRKNNAARRKKKAKGPAGPTLRS